MEKYFSQGRVIHDQRGKFKDLPLLKLVYSLYYPWYRCEEKWWMLQEAMCGASESKHHFKCLQRCYNASRTVKEWLVRVINSMEVKYNPDHHHSMFKYATYLWGHH